MMRIGKSKLTYYINNQQFCFKNQDFIETSFRRKGFVLMGYSGLSIIRPFYVDFTIQLVPDIF